MNGNIGGIHIDRVGDLHGKTKWILGSSPEFAFSVMQPGGAVHRLHRGVGKIRYPVFGLDDSPGCS